MNADESMTHQSRRAATEPSLSHEPLEEPRPSATLSEGVGLSAQQSLQLRILAIIGDTPFHMKSAGWTMSQWCESLHQAGIVKKDFYMNWRASLLATMESGSGDPHEVFSNKIAEMVLKSDARRLLPPDPEENVRSARSGGAAARNPRKAVRDS